VAKDMSENRNDLNSLLGFGSLTAALYVLLFYFEIEIVEITSKGGWSFLIPVVIAFAISYGHGNFTSAFWDWLGIRPKH
jgi:hypothetical protein